MHGNKSVRPKITRFHHVTIEVNDIEVAFQFYNNILGFEELPTPGHLKTNGIRWLNLPGKQSLHLILSKNVKAPKSAHFAILVEDVDKWEKYLNDHNVQTHQPKFDIYNAKRFFFMDPSGNRIEFVK